MFKNIQLRKKLTILLIIVFLGGTIISGTALATALNYNAQNQITSEALILEETMLSIREYTDKQVRPELENRSETEEFLPETVPSYSAREVFEQFRKNKNYSEFFYREATLNPTNPRDQADNFEIQIVDQFREEANRKDLSGFRTGPTGELFYIARPLKITEPSCLECHSTPERAPKSMISRYGKINGFGWKLNEIIGAQVIYVPAQKVFQKARQSFVLIIGITIAVFALAIFLVNSWLNRYVVLPLKQISQVAEAVSIGDMNAEFEYESQDEVGIVAKSFTRMKTSLVMAMKRLEQYRNTSQ